MQENAKYDNFYMGNSVTGCENPFLEKQTHKQNIKTYGVMGGMSSFGGYPVE
jgi:hypothetical protein